MARLGDKVDRKQMTSGVPPVLLQVQAEGYVKLNSRAEIQAWEEDVRKFYGVAVHLGDGMHACETCSGGCSDDCGLVAA